MTTAGAGGLMSNRYRVNNPRVMHETIEDEVIVVDLTTGSYYSLRATGAEIWHALERGLPENEIAGAIAGRYEGALEDVAAAVAEFLRLLSEEGLVESWNGTGEASPSELAPTVEDDRPRERFQPPVLEKHTDMQDLILLDPVHDVGAQGWPHPQADQS
jgi:coenzyme PQQ synthesis protein D (PqqD)